jgi:hypothetical protein
MNEHALDTVLMLAQCIRETRAAALGPDEISDALKVHGDLHSMSKNRPAVRVTCTLQVTNCLEPAKPVTTVQFTLPPGIGWDMLYSIVMDLRRLAEEELKSLVVELAKWIKE